MWAMGGLAGMLEFIKIILAVAFPFLQYRDIKRERKVLFYLKICFILSIMASMNFFLTGGEIERSPASNITVLLYEYIPVFSIIPLKFSQFITTMSLSILIEAFIIFLPMLAPIMFLEKDYSRKKKYTANTSFEKIKEIVTVIPERFIDRLHRKVVGESESIENDNLQIKEVSEDIKVLEINEKPKLKLLKNNSNENPTYDKDSNKNKFKKPDYNKVTKENNETFVQDKDQNQKLENKKDLNTNDNGNFAQDNIQDEDLNNWYQENEWKVNLLKKTIEDHRDCEVCPSIVKLMELTNMTQGNVGKAKKVLEALDYICTVGKKTYVKKYMDKEKKIEL
jgi:hypothetical protein